MKGQSFYKGSFILMTMVAVTKVMGLFYKLMLTNLLGGTGMACFQSVYAVFTPVYAIAIGGIPSAVAIMTAENFALERYKNARKIRRTALAFFTLTGAVAALITALCSGVISKSLSGSANLSPGLIAAAPTVLFCCVISVYRGYSEGLCDMIPTAVSETIEAFFKLLLGLAFAYITYKKTKGSYDTATALSLTAAASILGVSMSSLFACIYLALRLRIKGDGMTKRQLDKDRCTDSRRHIIRELTGYAFPIAMTAAISTLINTVDLLTVPAMLGHLQGRGLLDVSPLSGSGIEAQDIPEFIYGSFTALALTVTGIIPGFTAMLGKPALPKVSKARACGDKAELRKGLDDIFLLSSLIAFPASFGMTVFSREVLQFLFPARVYETAVSADAFAVLCAGLSAGCMLPPVFALLQAVGRPKSCVRIMLVSCLVKLMGNLTFMLIPGLGVTGAALSLVAADMTALLIALILLKKSCGSLPDVRKCILSPAFAAMLCAAGARLCYDRLFTGILTKNSRACLLISILSGSIIYIFSLYLLNIMPKRVFFQGKLKKIAKRA